MAHNLNIIDGRVSMMYFDKPAWHQLGQRLDHPASAKEAIEQGGLDFKVVKRPLQAIMGGRRRVDVPENFATVRLDTNEALGVVGSRYEPVQNSECFSFFDPLVDRSESMYHTAGVIGRGEKVWLLAKFPDYIRLKGDKIDKYLLLYNSHDGSSHIRIRLTPVRVVCQNTLSVALSGSDQEVRIKHTLSAPDKLQETHKLLGLTNSLYEQLEYIFGKMSLRKVSDKELLHYVTTLIPDNPAAENHARTDNLRNKILTLHEDQADARIHRGTVFGVYNAVTELVDHFGTSDDPSKRLKIMWFGGGERLKQRAFALAEDFLKN